MLSENPTLKIVRKIPRGKVATYGQIARLANIKSPRLVGKTLHQNPNPQTIPCNRVVFKNGHLSNNFAFGGIKKQAEKLRREGIKIKNFKIANLENFIWKP